MVLKDVSLGLLSDIKAGCLMLKFVYLTYGFGSLRLYILVGRISIPCGRKHAFY